MDTRVWARSHHPDKYKSMECCFGRRWMGLVPQSHAGHTISVSLDKLCHYNNCELCAARWWYCETSLCTLNHPVGSQSLHRIHATTHSPDNNNANVPMIVCPWVVVVWHVTKYSVLAVWFWQIRQLLCWWGGHFCPGIHYEDWIYANQSETETPTHMRREGLLIGYGFHLPWPPFVVTQDEQEIVDNRKSAVKLERI